MLKTAKLLALSLAATIAFTGCAQIPRDGTIQLGPNLKSELTTDYLYYSPSGPVAGDSVDQILNGFIYAGTGPQNDYAVAREFLSTTYQSEWKPNERVLIQDGRPKVTAVGDNTLSVVISASAEVDATGAYRDLPSNYKETFQFKFQKDGSEWRIAKAPNVTFVIRPVFDVIFRPYSVYFFDNQQQNLVPDVRWFPSRASTSTRLVDAMLQGPSPWLDRAVRSPIPNGTKLTLSTVTVSNGEASVDLSAKALSASVSELQMIVVQLRETLLQLSGVYQVNVSIERTPVESVPITPGLVVPQTYSPVGLVDGSLAHIDAGTTTTITSASKLISDVSATDFALSQNEDAIALVGKTGIYYSSLTDFARGSKRLTPSAGMLSPIIDRQGYTWVIPKDGKSSVQVFDSNANRIAFNTGWLAGVDRQDFSISSEGSRIAIVTGKAGAGRVRVASIVRDQNGVPRFIENPNRSLPSRHATSVTWLDQNQIGLLDKIGEATYLPVISMVGGSTSSLATIDNAVSIVGSGSDTSIYVRDEFDTVSQYRGSSWTALRNGVSALHYSGN